MNEIKNRSSNYLVNAQIEEDLGAAQELIDNELSENTRLSYSKDLKDFRRYCESIGGQLTFPVSPQVVLGYIGNRSKYQKATTVSRRVYAISKLHKIKKLPNPLSDEHVKSALSGLNKRGDDRRRAKPLGIKEIRSIIGVWDNPEDLKSIRNRALLLLGYMIAARQSELSRLECRDLDFRDDGVIVHKRNTKTRKNLVVGILYRKADTDLCAVRALETWLSSAGIRSGKVFRKINKGGKTLRNKPDKNGFLFNPRSVSWVIKLTEELSGRQVQFSGHSLRSGHVTDAYAAGIDERVIHNTTGQSIPIMREYERGGKPFDCSASELVSLLLEWKDK